MNIYETPRSALSDDHRIESIPGARRYFILVVISFVLNWALASIAIFAKSRYPEALMGLVILWGLATISYSVCSGLYFSKWGKYRFLWSFVVLLLQPISLLVTFPYILLRSYRYSWHKGT